MSRKTVLIIAALPASLAVIVCLLNVTGFMFIRSGTDIVEEMPSPDSAYIAMVAVHNGGATTDYSTQISLVPKGPISHFLATGSPGNVFIADGNDGAVPVNGQGLMDVELKWESPSDLLVYFPPNARVYKQESKIHSIVVKYTSHPW